MFSWFLSPQSGDTGTGRANEVPLLMNASAVSGSAERSRTGIQKALNSMHSTIRHIKRNRNCLVLAHVYASGGIYHNLDPTNSDEFVNSRISDADVALKRVFP
ncbi:hypothetical protein DESC_320069 [Desulfosarcina cetonica]|nr:hypothetical protein DESC_320069 [Desulfosarcina cetonica]